MSETLFVPDRDHPVIPIMARLAREAGTYDELLHADVRQRAAVTLTVEMLDMISPNMLAHPQTLPLTALALRAYAELLGASAELIETAPHLQHLVDEHERHHHRGGRRS